MANLSRSPGSFVFLILLLLSGMPFGCGTSLEQEAGSETAVHSPRESEVVSLLGQPLFSHEDVQGYIAAADRALAADPNNLDVLLEVAGVRASAWQYRGAIELYTRAIELAPDDWRPYRFRGHRYISLRQFEKAVADLEKSRELAPYNLDVSNHLGLAYYLQGRFDDAAAEYGRCMALAEDAEASKREESESSDEPLRTCMEITERDSDRVVITDWAYRALRRAGRDEEAQKLLETIPADLSPEANAAYYLILLFYKGLLTEEEVLSPDNLSEHRYETLAYGIANWHWVEGDEAAAVDYWRKIAEDEYWPGFGRIAAEADLARMEAARQPERP